MAADGKQSFARRDLVQQIEADVQKKWSEAKIFEMEAPDEKSEKFMCTFPFPYMNGLLHIGHAFTLTKAAFAAHFQRLLGKKVLFPFGFHCTGMPIQAAANKLRREFEVYGAPFPTFPAGRPAALESSPGVIDIDADGVTLVWKSPASTGQRGIRCHRVLRSIGGGDFAEVAVVPHPGPEALREAKGKVSAKVQVESGGCVYKVRAELEDGSACPDSKESAEVSVDAAPKDKKGGAAGGKRVAKKILAKTGDAAFQYEILLQMGLKPEELAKFSDPEYWLHYFPPLGARDLKLFGMPIDFRRSFITTSVNPYYDSFIRWQFRRLKAADKIGFGKRPTIYSELDGQACMDHDRDEGEGVAPQEYVAIKVEILELPAAMKALEGQRVFLLAATLRPETMPGQTNCWIKPEGTYGCFRAGEGEVYVCSHRAARNMSFQDILAPWGRPECLLEVTGQELLGARVRCPTAKYDAVYLLPLLTIKMDKGTGVVTSVPSDSPDDYAAFTDLLKPGKCEHFGLKKEWVAPFELVPIIDVEIDGEMQTLAAKYMCEKLGVQSQKDAEKLLEAHDVCYKLGFDKGVMSAGPFKGQPVKKAKLLFRAQMIKDGQAFLYSEPEKRVTSRSGDECVVALIDQWYLKYGEEGWKEAIKGHVRSDAFCAYNERNQESLLDAIDWLKEWACSRSFGLGTRVPWDEQFLIESLSDSTIYMAYYTVAHLLQGDLNGAQQGAGKVAPADLTDAVWDYVFVGGPPPQDSKVPQEVLEKMRKEFRFWYPMDLRVSGKDLIQNHLTMALYNHACIWEREPEMWPRGYFCNGWLLVNNEKMSKSKGNFFTLAEIMKKFSVDTVRLALADSGDTLEPANFNETVANKALLAFPVFLETMKALVGGGEPCQEGECSRFVDRWFANEMNRLVKESRTYYETMYYREALRTAYFEFTAAFDQYKDVCRASKVLPSRALAMRYYEWQLVVLSPICPHFCDNAWALLGKPGSVLDARYPEPTAEVDTTLGIQGDFVYNKVPHDFIKLMEKASKGGRPASAHVYVARSFPEWKVAVLSVLRQKHQDGQLPLVSQEMMKSDEAAKAQWKDIMQVLMQDPALKPFGKHLGPFAAFKRDEAAVFGATALEASVPFDELGLLEEHAEYLREKLKMDVAVLPSEQPAAPEHKDAAANAQPGKPGIHYTAAQNGDAPVGKASGGGKAASGKAAGSGGSAKAKAIGDVKQLDGHLSTRSYFEGGPRPSAADAAQFAATPANMDAEKFPHAARWYRHIGSFTAAQRASW